jgi:glycosyltransferase involved in cell wall biosynthesis
VAENKRFAVVTPYYKESPELLRRCIDSVLAQDAPCDHFVVADGFPQDWLDAQPVRHIKLDRNHADFGNTPRGLGSLLAASEGYEGIAFLDADNWFDADHVSACVAAAEKFGPGLSQCDYVIARRRFRHVDGSELPTPVEDSFADTSCFVVLRGAFHVLSHWVLMPKRIAPICDKVFRRPGRCAAFVSPTG